MQNQRIEIIASQQIMHCYDNNHNVMTFPVSTGKNGLGELINSECTPRGLHIIHSIIGLENEINSVFVSRKWTGEIYNEELANAHPSRDWILTRILQLDGIEPGFNKGGNVDTLSRYIYIHGTPDSNDIGKPGSHGCIRMRNKDIIKLSDWIKIGTRTCIIE